MFGRTGKIKKAIAKSLSAALAGGGAAAFAPIEKLREEEKVDAYVDLCQQLIYEEDLEAADAAVDQALQLAPEQLYVLDAKAEVAVEDGRLGDALALYQKMYEISPDDPAVISGLGGLYLSNDDAAAAVELLEATASDEPAVKLRLGEALYAADRAEEGLALLEQVFDYYDSSLRHASFVDNIEAMVARRDEARRLRDDVFAELHGREATIEKQARAGGLDASAGVNYKLLGQALAAESDYVPSELRLDTPAASLRRAELLLEQRADDPVGLVLRGCAELREAALDDALASFEAATAADGHFFPGFLGLGAAMDCGSQGFFKKAKSLSPVGEHAALTAVVPDWPVLTEPEQRVVWASVAPLAAALPALAAAGATIRILPIDVRATDLSELAAGAGERLEDDHRSLDAIEGLATRGLAVAKIEELVAVVGDGAWTFAHELSHLVFFAVGAPVRARVEELYEAALEVGYAVSEYQTNNPDELFAVAYTNFLRDRYQLEATQERDEAGIAAALFDIFAGLSAEQFDQPARMR